jgi:hypothetical protein
MRWGWRWWRRSSLLSLMSSRNIVLIEANGCNHTLHFNSTESPQNLLLSVLKYQLLLRSHLQLKHPLGSILPSTTEVRALDIKHIITAPSDEEVCKYVLYGTVFWWLRLGDPTLRPPFPTPPKLYILKVSRCITRWTWQLCQKYITENHASDSEVDLLYCWCCDESNELCFLGTYEIFSDSAQRIISIEILSKVMQRNVYCINPIKIRRKRN